MRRIIIILIPLMAGVAILFWIIQKQTAESVAYRADHVWTVQAADSAVRSIAFSPDDAYLAIGGWGRDKDCQLTILNTRSLELKRLGEPTESIESVAFSPDGETLASAGSDRVIKLWDVRTRECKSMLRGHGEWIEDIAFSPDGSTLASIGYHELKLWSVDTRELKWEAETRGYPGVWFTPDGKQVITGSMRYDSQSGHQIRDVNRRVAMSRTGNVMLRPIGSGKLELLDARTGLVQHTLNPGLWSNLWTASFSHDDRLLAVGGLRMMNDDWLKIYDVQTGSEVWAHSREGDATMSLAFANKSNDLGL